MYHQNSGHRRGGSDSSAVRSTTSSYKSNPFSLESFGQSPSHSVSQSIVSSQRPYYLSDASSGIIGNFVPIAADGQAMSGPLAEVTIPYREALSKNGERYRAANPYEFEPDSPYLPTMRQTTFKDFIVEPASNLVTSNARSQHTESVYSDNNDDSVQRATPCSSTPSEPRRMIQRSESSPDINHDQHFCYRSQTPEAVKLLAMREQRIARDVAPSFPTLQHDQSAERISRQDLQGSYSVYSPTRSTGSKDSAKNPSMRGRTRSPTKSLGDVAEADESDLYAETPTLPPTKRSRSPMKKMFGENGWLGKSPNEMDFKTKPNQPLKEKFSMMGKIKHKLEEFAVKADLSPMSGHRSSKEKHQRISILSVSLGPPEQARIYMEVELMLVHTANVFLMLQFSQGRMAVDSIKKTVDGWRNKGRPVVIEFMYDQATQRELVVANQDNFRFHGERAADELRINSMLYNWKHVASLMAIRTFCVADTIVLKLLFDIEQILEFLGASDPVLLRLQQIRASAVEMMRVARQKKTPGNGNTDMYGAARETMSSSASLAGYSSRTQSVDESYGEAWGSTER